MAKQDMFGIPESDNDQDGAEGADYVVIQITPAEGWRAVFSDPTIGGTAIRTLGLACFALVEILPGEHVTHPMVVRAIRPMVADELGQIDDVESFEDFICVVPPGSELQATVDYAIRAREIEEKQAQT
jgi:hypothetical protein